MSYTTHNPNAQFQNWTLHNDRDSGDIKLRLKTIIQKLICKLEPLLQNIRQGQLNIDNSHAQAKLQNIIPNFNVFRPDIQLQYMQNNFTIFVSQ